MRKSKIHFTKIFKNRDKKRLLITTFIVGLIGVVFITVFVSQNEEIHETPPGFIATGERGVFHFSRKPTVLGAEVDRTGFSQEELTVTLEYPDSAAVLRLKNIAKNDVSIKIPKTPDGDFPDGSTRIIRPNQERIIHLTKIGLYTVTLANDPQKQLVIKVKLP